MQIPFSQAVQLLHQTRHAVLGTHSTQLPGYPYGTAVPLVVDGQHRPLLLISALAEHTRNLLADSRASLAVVEDGRDNVQDAARITLLGRCERFEPSPELVERYLRYQPAAEQYLQLDFMFFRLLVERARYIGGVGRMGWLETADWQSAEKLTPAEEKCLLEEGAALMPAQAQLLGIDAFGIDLEHGGRRLRRQFVQPGCYTAIKQMLPDLLAGFAAEASAGA